MNKFPLYVTIQAFCAVDNSSDENKLLTILKYAKHISSVAACKLHDCVHITSQ